MSPTIRHLRPRHLLRLIGCALLLFAGTGRGAAQGQPSQLLLKDIAPGAASADPRLLTTVGDRVFFTAAAPDTGRELWTSDGTEAGTRLVADLTPGPDSSAINVMAAFDGRLLFLLQTAGGFELRASDGAGTTLIASAEGQYPDRGFAVSAGAVYFSTQTFPGIGGTHRLWRSDGSTAGTASLAQVTGAGLVSSIAPRVIGDQVYVHFSDGYGRFGGVEFLWFDGSDLVPVAGCSYSSWETNCGGTAGWSNRLATATNSPPRLQFNNGAISQTLALQSLPIVEINGLVGYGQTLLFGALSADRSMWLWRSDGTLAGTQPVRQLSQAGGGRLDIFAAAHGLLYFNYTPGSGYNQLWATDGTAAGTRQITGQESVPNGFASVNFMAAAGDRLVFFADDRIHGLELWQITAANAAPTLVHDVEPGPGSSSNPIIDYDHSIATLRGGLVWNARDVAAGNELRYLAPGFAPYAKPAWGGGPSGGLATAPVTLGNRGAASQPVTLTLRLPAGVSLASHTLGVAPTIAGDTATWALPALPTGEHAVRLAFRLPEAPLGTAFTATLSLEPSGATAPVRLAVAHQRYLPLAASNGR